MSTNLPLTKTKILISIVIVLLIMFLSLGKYIFIGDNLLSAFFKNNEYIYLGIMIVLFIAWILDMKM